MITARHEPMNPFRHFHDEVSRFLDESRRVRRDPATGSAPAMPASDWRPAVDVREEDARFVIAADVPGVTPETIEITMEEGVLTIRGERRTRGEDEAGYTRAERANGRFERRFSLPDTADASGISARTEHGVLEVSIPKKAATQPRRIPVA